MNKFFTWFDNLPNEYFLYILFFIVGYILKENIRRGERKLITIKKNFTLNVGYVFSKKIILILILILTLMISNIVLAEELFQPGKGDKGKIDYSWPKKLEYHGKSYDTSKHRHHHGDILYDVYGNWTQTFETNSGTVRIIFKKVEDTWYNPVKNSPKDSKVREIEFKQIQDVYEIKVELRDVMKIIELKTPEKLPEFSNWTDKTAIIFKDYFRFIPKTRDEGHWAGYARIDCVNPSELFPSFQVIKPKMVSPLFRKFKTYQGFDIDLKNDIFVNGNRCKNHFTKVFKENTYDNFDEKELNAKFFYYLLRDGDNDSIIDVFQIDGPGSNLATFAGGFEDHKDSNGDTIQDVHQTKSMYHFYGMSNFLDLDKDGLCDNYKPGIYNKEKLTASYDNITVDLSEDPFQNKQAAEEHMMIYRDRNDDDIIDCVQKPDCSSQLTGKKFVDKNNDTIDDNLQTVSAYNRFGLDNFIDRDGDGLCDNYLQKD